MNNESAKDTNVKATIDAVTGLVEAVPVYQDVVQPAAQQIGKSLETVAKTVNIALVPIKMLVWGYEQIEGYVTKRVSEKLKNVPPENIITPAPQIAGPAIEALRYTGHEENLRELYANLLATAMDKETALNAHPGYVDIIKNLTPDEALILTIFINTDRIPLINVKAFIDKAQNTFNTIAKNYSHIANMITLTNPSLVGAYIDNLCRLGILEIPNMLYINDVEVYKVLENDEIVERIKKELENSGREVGFERKQLRLTDYGKLFVQNIVKEKS